MKSECEETQLQMGTAQRQLKHKGDRHLLVEPDIKRRLRGLDVRNTPVIRTVFPQVYGRRDAWAMIVLTVDSVSSPLLTK